MEKDKIEVGMVVRLKSGSPLMTVDTISTINGYTSQEERRIRCVWFDGCCPHNEMFALNAIEKSE